MKTQHSYNNIYIGPAAQCPCPPIDERLLIISGDQGRNAENIINNNSQSKQRETHHYLLINGTIGKGNGEKNWYIFNRKFLNGTFPEKLVNWCSSNGSTSAEAYYKIRCEKLETYIDKSHLFDNSDLNYRLIIAQGDPFLTLKRSKNIIQKTDVIDFSPHPLAMIWSESIAKLLKNSNFYQHPENSMLWITKHREHKYLTACETPSRSEGYLDRSIQILTKTISLDNIRLQQNSKGKENNDLSTLRSLVTEGSTADTRPSIKALIKQRFAEQLTTPFWKNISWKELYPKSNKTNNIYDTQSLNSYSQSKESINQPILRGCIDGFKQNYSLYGWVDASDFGTGESKIKIYWCEKNQLVGEAVLDIPRPDLKITGIIANICGFCIPLKFLENINLFELLDNTITLKLVETKSGNTLGEEPWIISNKEKYIILKDLLTQRYNKEDIKDIYKYLSNSSNQFFLASTRGRLLEIESLKIQMGRWDTHHIDNIFECTKVNPVSDYGCRCESMTRLELIFVAIVYLIKTIDSDNILNGNFQLNPAYSNTLNAEYLKSNLQERSFIGLQKFENQLWAKAIRPLFDILMASIFLQKKCSLPESSIQLIKTLASLAFKVYTSDILCFQLLSIADAKNRSSFNQDYISLAHERGDRFTYLLANYTNNLHNNASQNNLFYLSSAIDLSAKSLTLLRYISFNLEPLLQPHRANNPRQSKPLHWLDRLGLTINHATQQIINKMQELNFPRSEIISIHEETIEVKKYIAEALWKANSPSIRDNGKYIKYDPKNWLIVGEKSLSQCWMYRVEQKKEQLIELGYNVKCVDLGELIYWSITHDVLWSDRIILCRAPAMYHVFRFIAYARSCNKKVYYEIDDDIFTDAYPADFESYGNSISYQQYKNLCSDYPLRYGLMNYADEIIVSTPILASRYEQSKNASGNKVNILPNLPLPPLVEISDQIAENIEAEVANKPNRIIITSGTLSHKSILIGLIFPTLLEIMEQYNSLELTVVGFVNLPNEFIKFKNRIKSVAFTDYESYLQEIKSCSVALVPLERHQTTDGKSAIKWMEASLCGTASICSPVKAYTEVAKHCETVLFAETRDQWTAAIQQLLDDALLTKTIARNSFHHARELFNKKVGRDFWQNLINNDTLKTKPTAKSKKILLINVFFAPQSVGGATRVAQDYVLSMLNDKNHNVEVTVLCTDYDHWHSNPIQRPKHQVSEDDTDTYYRESFSLSVSDWNGARIIRLCVQPKPWSQYYDPEIEAFCDQLFQYEDFDLIQCHCCQILTAAPLISAKKYSIPYEIVMHDGWWMSPEQFLVSASGMVIDPGNPLAHFDNEPNEEEKDAAHERRNFLYNILDNAIRRIAVSAEFKRICENAGIKNVSVQENEYTMMKVNSKNSDQFNSDPNTLRLCHIGGMSVHKGYQLLRVAVQNIPNNLPFKFTIIDHGLADNSKNYNSIWNGYIVDFIAPIPMDQMSEFYYKQDVLLAPSIWPESFGLVSREALSAGLWVIASDAGALAEPIKNASDHVGSVIQPNNVQALVNALSELPEKLNKRNSDSADDRIKTKGE